MNPESTTYFTCFNKVIAVKLMTITLIQFYPLPPEFPKEI